MVGTIPYPPNLDYTRQSFEVPGTRRPGQTGHYRSGAWPNLVDLKTDQPLKTLLDCFESGLERGREKRFLGHRPVVAENPLTLSPTFAWQTYGEIEDRRRHLGSAIERLFAEGRAGGGDLPTVGIWSQNRPEWQIIDLALHAYAKVGVSLYDTLGPDSVEYIINHAELTIIFASSAHLSSLLALTPRCPTLKIIVSIDDISPQTLNVLTAWGKEKKIEVLQMRDLEALGKANPLPIIRPKPDQVASLCYTSGTTNVPKGVVLTHGQVAISCLTLMHGVSFGTDGILMSYLPLAHIYERLAELVCMTLGGAIGYFSNDPLRLLEDAQILRPTYFPSVPRVLNRVYIAAMAAAAVPGLKATLFNHALEVKTKKMLETGINTHPLWDRLVFRKIQAVLGGRIETLTCGSAPISAAAMNFLRVAMACDVIEGYGMTENCGTCTRVWPYDPSSTGTVGPPSPCNEVKLVDVPSMGYTAEDKPFPRGEFCVRGDNCFKQYYKDEKNTKETIDEEGWLHTGDIAEIDAHGRFRIIDRLKNIMKLAQGEYVALEKIENLYTTCPVVAQIYVHGDSLQDHLLAVVVPDTAQLATIASKEFSKHIAPTDLQELQKAIEEPKIVARIQKALDKEAKARGLKGFETVKRIHLTLDSFTPENGLLTPTFKVRRKDAYNKYKDSLDALYRLGAPSAAPTKL